MSIDDPSLDETLLELFHRSLLISSQKKEDHLLTLTGIVMHITGLLNYRLYCRNYAQQELADKIGKAKALMRDNVKENLNGRQLASRLGMGYDNFRRTFKKITGISPAQYMQDIKLEEAKKMLACSSISVKEISYDLNYENPCYFSKAFKKKEGMSPGEYRQMYEGILSIAT